MAAVILASDAVEGLDVDGVGHAGGTSSAPQATQVRDRAALRNGGCAKQIAYQYVSACKAAGATTGIAGVVAPGLLVRYVASLVIQETGSVVGASLRWVVYQFLNAAIDTMRRNGGEWALPHCTTQLARPASSTRLVIIA